MFQRLHFFGSVLLLIAVGLAGCKSEAENTSSNEISQDLVQYSLKFQLRDSVSIPREEQRVYEALQTNEPISFSALTKIFINQHVNAYNQRLQEDSQKDWSANSSRADFETLLHRLANLSENLRVENLHQMKIDYEARLQKNGDVFFDIEASSLVDFIERGRMQAYSGTSLQQVLLRQILSPAEFRGRNFVVIYENAHMLPGYLTKENDGWRLTGIETTTAGPSRVNYGFLENLELGVRIVDAELFILSEIFKSTAADLDQLRDEILRQSAKKYGIDLKESEKKIPSEHSDEPELSIFSFGETEIPPGTRIRNTLIEKSAEEDRGCNGSSRAANSRIFVDHRYDVSKNCEMKNNAFHAENFSDIFSEEAQGLLQYRWESLSPALREKILSIDLDRHYFLQLYIFDCLLFAVYSPMEAADEQSLALSLSSTLTLIPGDSFEIFKTFVEYPEDQEPILQIWDLSMEQEILDPSMLRYSALKSIQVQASDPIDSYLVLAYIPYEKMDRSALELAVFRPSFRAVVANVNTSRISKISPRERSTDRLEVSPILVHTEDGVFQLDLGSHPRLVPVQD